MQAACGVQKHHVVSVPDGVRDRSLRDIDGVRLPHLKDGDIELAAHDLQLLDGRRTVNVAGDEQRIFVLLFEKARELCAVGRFARALKTDQHHDRGRLGGHVDLLVVASHERRELFVHDLHDHLRRSQALEHIRADRALGGFLDKVLDDRVADVGLEKRQTNLAHGLFDVGFREPSFAAQLFERRRQLFGQAFKCHILLLYARARPQNFLLGLFRVGNGLQSFARGFDVRQRDCRAPVARDAAGHALEFAKRCFRSGKKLMHALSTHAELRGNFTQGEILIVIQVKTGTLLLTQKLSVIIQQQGHLQRVLLHGAPPELSIFSLYSQCIILNQPPFVKQKD